MKILRKELLPLAPCTLIIPPPSYYFPMSVCLVNGFRLSRAELIYGWILSRQLPGYSVTTCKGVKQGRLPGARGSHYSSYWARLCIPCSNHNPHPLHYLADVNASPFTSCRTRETMLESWGIFFCAKNPRDLPRINTYMVVSTVPVQSWRISWLGDDPRPETVTLRLVHVSEAAEGCCCTFRSKPGFSSLSMLPTADIMSGLVPRFWSVPISIANISSKRWTMITNANDAVFYARVLLARRKFLLKTHYLMCLYVCFSFFGGVYSICVGFFPKLLE